MGRASGGPVTEGGTICHARARPHDQLHCSRAIYPRHSTILRTERMSDKPSYLADFDSASAMLVALARFLQGQDFPLLGAMPKWSAPGMKVLASVINRLPRWAQEQVYIWSGW